MAEKRRVGAFAGISVLAMVHQVREHCRGLLPDVIGIPGGGYAGLPGGAGWMKEEFELPRVQFEDRGRTEGFPRYWHARPSGIIWHGAVVRG
jgi:hypothetical protein